MGVGVQVFAHHKITVQDNQHNMKNIIYYIKLSAV